MKRALTLSILVICAAAMSFAAPKDRTAIKVGTFEIGNETNRASLVKAGKTDSQRSWENSAEAVAAAIVDSDCDVMGVQDLGDVIGGRGEEGPSLKSVLDKVAGEGVYKLFIPGNKNANYPLDGHLGRAAGVLWKAGRFECLDWGISWLSGLYDKPGKSSELKFGDGSMAMAWVKLREKTTGKVFVFASAGTNGPSQNDHGKPIKYPEINTANCTNIVKILREDIVPDGTPSIFVLNSHNATSSDGYKALNSSRWFDVWDRLNDESLLSEDAAKQINTMNSEDEKRLQGGRPDHIFIDGFQIESYAVLRKKFPTADGSLHYPAFHFPVVAELAF